MGSIFLITVTYSWINYGGDISYERLASKGLNEAPEQFKFLQVFAPVVLLILTRFRMPVSTSILLLSAFATQASSITSILQKSFFGYFIAFVLAIIVWMLTTNLFEKYKNSKPSKLWLPLQWISSGALWSTWIMQDMANPCLAPPPGCPKCLAGWPAQQPALCPPASSHRLLPDLRWSGRGPARV